MSIVAEESVSGGLLKSFHEYLSDVEGTWSGLSAADRVQALKGFEEVATKFRGPSSPKVQSRRAVQDYSILLGSLGMIIWTATFAAGVVVPSSPFQAVLSNLHTNPVPFLNVIGAGLVVVACSTFSNPSILACLAALIGSVAREVGSHPQHKQERRRHASAVFRGFFVYLAMMSGLLLLTTQAILNATQVQYVQLAATISIVSFLVGYDPALFQRFVARISGFAQGKIVAEERDVLTESVERTKEVTIVNGHS